MFNVLGYIDRQSPIHQLSGATKLLGFLGFTIIGMVSYDTRFLILLSVVALIILKVSQIKWSEISFLVKFIGAFTIFNLLMVYVFAPHYGVQLYHSSHVLLGSGRYSLTAEQMFYELNMLIKYFLTVPLALTFLLTTNPSEFAAGLNRIGVSYKVAYAVALTLRYIPDVQNDFQRISFAQQARGYEISKKGKLITRIKGATQILIPLIFSSLERIESISKAMELRRFGANKKRTWYMRQVFQRADIIALIGVAAMFIIGIVLVVINHSRFWNPFM
ncbi:energy-coupling factor transporter transmembrane protein EcfT [Periweissella cryptocerci]|uniref:Energy-coupling factor transporter transmembrane protein EcfT n=1 Tax=Periweissella cryptocerci TaxID=2506420 RepID=A0A4P6YS45_9LACO|nr:energy-coupling factor transporter transmembrane component T [Periweissella cryptocerci]QBO35471.1 energy-coupling factor transporter transmembrane protein EcfT [Periweissella cryptocerci]